MMVSVRAKQGGQELHVIRKFALTGENPVLARRTLHAAVMAHADMALHRATATKDTVVLTVGARERVPVAQGIVPMMKVGRNVMGTVIAQLELGSVCVRHIGRGKSVSNRLIVLIPSAVLLGVESRVMGLGRAERKGYVLAMENITANDVKRKLARSKMVVPKRPSVSAL